MANKITTILDLDSRGFNKSVKSIRREIAETDGTFNKMKTGAKGAFSGVQQYGAEAAVAVGAALVAFGAKSVAAFNDTALAAGQMRDSLGVTAEEASRLIEVAEDLGIGTDTLERSIGIMNRTATNTPGHFAAIGAELVKNADGTTNVNETFLSTIDALNKIPDASARAAAAQKVFGRGWMEMSELIGLGAEGVRKALDSVEDGKIIDDSEVDRARKFRDTLDTLKGTVEELQVEIGGVLVPVLIDAAEALLTVKSAGEQVADFIPGPLKTALSELANQVERSFQPWKYYTDAKDMLSETEETVGTLGESVKAFESLNSSSAQTYMEHAAGMVRETKRIAKENEKATERIERAWSDLADELSDRSLYLDIQDALSDVEQAYMTAADTAGKSLAEQEADARNVERSVLSLKGLVDEYAKDVSLLPPEVATELRTLIDEGSYAEVERRLASLERVRMARIAVSNAGPDSYVGGGNIKPGSKIHDGGVVGVGKFASDEVPAVLQKGEMVLTEGQQAAVSAAMAGGGGGPTIYMTVNVAPGAGQIEFENAVIRAWSKYGRRNGPGGLPQ